MAKLKDQQVQENGNADKDIRKRGPVGRVDAKVFVSTLIECGFDPDEAAKKLNVEREYVFSKAASLRQQGLQELQLKRKSRKSNTISELRQLLTAAE